MQKLLRNNPHLSARSIISDDDVSHGARHNKAQADIPAECGTRPDQYWSSVSDAGPVLIQCWAERTG